VFKFLGAKMYLMECGVPFSWYIDDVLFHLVGQVTQWRSFKQLGGRTSLVDKVV